MSVGRQEVEELLMEHANDAIAGFTYWTITDVRALLEFDSSIDEERISDDMLIRIMDKAELFPSSSRDVVDLFERAKQYRDIYDLRKKEEPKQYEFKCPKCGNDVLEEIMVHATVSTDITKVITELPGGVIEFPYGEVGVCDGTVAHYQCGECDSSCPMEKGKLKLADSEFFLDVTDV